MVINKAVKEKRKKLKKNMTVDPEDNDQYWHLTDAFSDYENEKKEDNDNNKE